MAKNFIRPITLRSVDSSTLAAGSFSAIGDTIEYPLSYIRITNDSTQDVIISFDGSEDHIYLVSGTNDSIYYQINSTPNNNVSKLKANTTIYARGTAGVGLILVEGYYNEQ